MIRLSFVLALAAVAPPALAQTPLLDAARVNGSVGERYDGYIGIAGPVSAQVRSQIATINIRRRSLYSSLASRKGVSPQEVGITAGCQLLARVGIGQSFLLADGGWRRRGQGQPPPIPNYCR
jgi:hypothetical protein